MRSCFLQTFVAYIILLNYFCECVNKDVKALSMIYTTDSKSVNGKWCLNDCVDGRCAVDSNAIEECHSSGNPAPTYYTTGQHHPNQHKCTSRCTKLSGEVHPRCFVDHDWNKLDYCNPDITSTYEYRDYTFADGPCTDACRPSPNEPSYGVCNDISRITKPCYFDKSLYESVKTLNGYNCHGQCLRHDDKPYSWCYYGVGRWDPCARPALYNTPCLNCTISIKRQLEETVTKYAEQMERDTSLKTVTLTDPNNPIYSYTYNETMTPSGPVRLPLVVRARVYRSHVKARNSRGNDAISLDSRENCRRMGMASEDDCGYLIAYKYGGPGAFYNFVPMARAINLGSENNGIVNPSAWVSAEREIAEFVGVENGQVNIVVVLRYNLNDRTYPYRPYRIGRGQWGIASNGDVVLKCSNHWNTYN